MRHQDEQDGTQTLHASSATPKQSLTCNWVLGRAYKLPSRLPTITASPAWQWLCPLELHRTTHTLPADDSVEHPPNLLAGAASAEVACGGLCTATAVPFAVNAATAGLSKRTPHSWAPVSGSWRWSRLWDLQERPCPSAAGTEVGSCSVMLHSSTRIQSISWHFVGALGIHVSAAIMGVSRLHCQVSQVCMHAARQLQIQALWVGTLSHWAGPGSRCLSHSFQQWCYAAIGDIPHLSPRRCIYRSAARDVSLIL